MGKAFILAGVFATFLGFLGNTWWVFDLFSHFRAQYALLLLVGTALAFFLRSGWLAGLAAGALCVNVAWIVPFYTPPVRQSSGTSLLRAVQLNVLVSNKNHEAVSAFLRESEADVVVLEEVDDAWMAALSDPAYPYVEQQVRQDPFGIALLSRWQIEQAHVIDLGSAGTPSIVARLNIEGRRLNVIGAHALPPTSARWAGGRDRQMLELAALGASLEGPVIILGDLNATSWSPVFATLLKVGKLSDSRIGFGLQPSWPALLPMLGIPIDHCLVSPQIRIHRRQLGPKVGSDHLPVLVDFSLPAA